MLTTHWFSLLLDRLMQRKQSAILLLCLIAANIVALSQDSLPSSNSPGSGRDAHALELIQAMVETTGGLDAWNSVRSAHISGTVRSHGLNDERTFTWDEDWSTGSPNFRRETDNSQSTSVYEQKPSGVSSSAAYGRVSPSSLSLLESAIIYSPAIAMRAVLTDSSYRVRLYQSPTPATTQDCVSISRSAPTPTDVVLCFNLDHHPSMALVGLQKQSHPRLQQYKRIVFSSFRQQGNVELPSLVTIYYPSGKALDLSFSSLEANAHSSK